MPAVRPRGEEQRRARPAHSAGRERDAPHPGHVHGQATARRPALSVAGVGEDAAAAEVGDEQVAAERAEPARRKRDAPRLVEGGRRRDARDEAPLQIELVDESARRGIVAVDRRTPGVGDEQLNITLLVLQVRMLDDIITDRVQ